MKLLFLLLNVWTSITAFIGGWYVQSYLERHELF